MALTTTSRFQSSFSLGDSGVKPRTYHIFWRFDETTEQSINILFPSDGSALSSSDQAEWDTLITIYESAAGFQDADGNEVEVVIGRSY